MSAESELDFKGHMCLSVLTFVTLIIFGFTLVAFPFAQSSTATI